MVNPPGRPTVQGVIKAFDPATGEGSLLRDTDLAELPLAPDALDGSVFRMLRQGQRVVFDLDDHGRATRLHLGSEVDMGTPGFDPTTGEELDPGTS
jgi:CspA family cold shock protein